MKFLIAGGGIGGLATALAMSSAGQDVEVFESATSIAGHGLGIQLQSLAVRELAALGLGAALAGHAAPIERLSYFNVQGQQVWSEPRGTAAGLMWPQYAMHRGQLQQLLHGHLRRVAPGVAVQTGYRLERFDSSPDGVVAQFSRNASGEADWLSVQADALIGADGLHSRVRCQLHPNQPLRYGGQLMWRNSTRRPALLDGRTAVIVGHRDQKLVAYPMSPPDSEGRVLLNWLVERATGNEVPPREEWNRRVATRSIEEHFSSWRFDWLDVPELLAEAGEVFEFPKVDRDPLPAWTHQRVTLVGDAAHPITPVGAQGASQAIVDARALAFHLARAGTDVGAGLQRYEADRLPLLNEIARRNRAMGAEQMLDLVHSRAPAGFGDLEAVLPAAERRALAEAYGALSGLQAWQVNSTSPYTMN
jgi:2-polyprenyl-6-methoxyphenol hydroxylase-like FAD-dependent oxidoreductase